MDHPKLPHLSCSFLIYLDSSIEGEAVVSHWFGRVGWVFPSVSFTVAF